MPKGVSSYSQRHGRTPAERIANRTKRNARGCLIWQGFKNRKGYGMIFFQGRTRLVHNVVWMLHHKRSIPSGKIVCHACDTPACAEHKHLYLGTHASNANDRDARGRHWSQTGSYRQRHKLTPRQVRHVMRIGYSMTEAQLAERFGVSVTTIGKIRCGRY